jgi:outer membrane protein assembly factor BamB
MRVFSASLICCLCASWCGTAGAAEDWPQFRGPSGDGHSTAANLPATWSETENIVWKTPVEGKGWSSPVLADGVVWLTSAVVTPVDEATREKIRREKLANNPVANQMDIVGPVKLFVVGIDVATGKQVDRIELFDVAEPDPIHSLNSYASPSPIVRDGKLFCHFGKFGTACVDLASRKIVWKRNLVIDHSVGPGSSPVLWEDKLIIPCDGTDEQYVIALNAATGEAAWKAQRPPLEGSKGDMHKAFSTPLVVTQNGKTQVIAPGAQWFVAYDPVSGDELWRFRHGSGFSNVPRPVVRGDVAYLCTGFMVPELCAVRTSGEQDVTDSHLAWRHKRQVPSMTSPIVVGDEVYFVSDQGVLSCLDASSGELLWQKRLTGNFSASPLFADGKLYFCSREGATTVLRPGKEYNELAINQLDGQLMASPAAIDGALLLRSDTHLYRVGK